MKKIKQLIFVLFIFSVLVFSYPVTQVFAQGGAGMNDGGECDPNPACVENCCNECDPNPACVENCCPAESPENPNNAPGSSGSGDTGTFCPNCVRGSLGQRGNIPGKPNGNITRDPRSNMLRKPTGKILRHPSTTTTNKPTSGITRNPRGSNGSRSIPNIQGTEDRANRRPQSRTSTPLFIPPRGTEPNVRLELQTNISCENIRAEIGGRLEDINKHLSSIPWLIKQSACVLPRQRPCIESELTREYSTYGLLIILMEDAIKELFDYINDHCL